MLFHLVWQVPILLAIYGLLLAALIFFLRQLGVPARRAVLAGFVVYGGISGLLTAWAWPYDSSVYPNLPATLLADQVYQLSSESLGAPWMLQVPQIYLSVSIVLCSLLGLAVQWVYNRATAGRPKDSV
jgi:hypothetical protein